MIPVDQTTFGGREAPADLRGDCFSAALAALLESDLGDVPRFCELDPDADWTPDVNEWLRPHGLAYVALAWSPYVEDVIAPSLGGHLIFGQSPRGHRHTVVGYAGAVEWDPHPSRDGLHPNTEEEPWILAFLVPLEPENPRPWQSTLP